jgi:hypothetical protein
MFKNVENIDLDYYKEDSKNKFIQHYGNIYKF